MVATDLMERAGEDRVNGWKRTCREGAGPISHRVFFPRDEEGTGKEARMGRVRTRVRAAHTCHGEDWTMLGG